MERHYQTVESVIYLECYIDQKSVGGGGGDKIARQGSDMSLARETKAICFRNIFVFSFFFFFFHNTELYDTTFRSCCKMNNSKKLLSMFGISFVME